MKEGKEEAQKIQDICILFIQRSSEIVFYLLNLLEYKMRFSPQNSMGKKPVVSTFLYKETLLNTLFVIKLESKAACTQSWKLTMKQI